MKTIAVMGALDEEAALLSYSLEHKEEREEAGLHVVAGELMHVSGERIRIVVTVAGMGTVAAAAAAQYLITRFSPCALFFSGIAGALGEGIRINDIVVGERLAYLDTDMELISQAPPALREYSSDPDLMKESFTVLDKLGRRWRSGLIVTSNRFIDTLEQKKKIFSLYPEAQAAEMEGAAVAHVAAKNNVPVLILRAMSDNTDTAYEEFCTFDISQFADNAAEVMIELLRNIPETVLNR